MTLLSILAALGFALALHALLTLHRKAQAAGRRASPYPLAALAVGVYAAFNLPEYAVWWLIGFLAGPSVLFWLAAAGVNLNSLFHCSPAMRQRGSVRHSE